MRFLLKFQMRDQDAADPGINMALQALCREVSAQAAYATQENGRRVDWLVAEIEPRRITPLAEIIFRRFGVKTEFLPETVPQPYFGRLP